MLMRPPHSIPSERSHISFQPEGSINGVEGARRVIQTIASRPAARSLNLAHHALGGEGSVELFDWLCSEEGRRCILEEMDLRKNNLGDLGFDALSKYISEATSLKDLRLDEFPSSDKSILRRFVDAVTSSHLGSLTISGPRGGDTFLPILLADLTKSHIHRLRVSMSHLTSTVAPAIATFVASPQCRLSSLTFNGNNIGVEGVKQILDALTRNYCITTLEFYANSHEDDPPDSFVALEDRKKRLITRNRTLKKSVKQESLVLLRCSRILLLRGGRAVDSPEARSVTPSFMGLPLELKHYILTFLTTMLSDAQCIRVIRYASTTATLPQLLPTLRSRGCIPDPSTLSPATASGCANGCMGTSNTLACRRDEERESWFKIVDCEMYEPDHLSDPHTSPIGMANSGSAHQSKPTRRESHAR